MLNWFLVAIGGALGSMVRYGTGLAATRLLGPSFPWGTIAVNIAGSFMIGVFIEAIARRFNASEPMMLFLVTGFLGGFTTFSSFSLDSVALIERGEIGLSLVYILASLGLSIIAVYAGLSLMRTAL